jgi:hypothetical protein
MEIGVLGGTGPAGQGIALRLAASGNDVIVGSRDAARAAGIVDGLREQWGDRVRGLRPGDNAAAAAAPVVVVATVWDAAVDTARAHADALAGKVVLVIANGMEKVGREFRPVMPEEGSVSAAVQAAVPAARVAAAFQHIPAAELEDLDHELHADVLVAADDDEARELVLALVDDMPGLRGFDAGSLANAVGIEALTAALITVNVRHKGKASVHFSGVEPRARTRS